MLANGFPGGEVSGGLQCCGDMCPLLRVLVELSASPDEVGKVGADRRGEVVVELGAVEHCRSPYHHHPLLFGRTPLLSHLGYAIADLTPDAEPQDELIMQMTCK